MNNELEEIRKMCAVLMEKIDAIAAEDKRSDAAPPSLSAYEMEQEPTQETEEEIRENLYNPFFEREAELIGLTGTKRGIGVTHHCVLLAAFLQAAGVAVAIADFTGQEGLENCGIPYYKADEQILDEIAYQYQIILLDLGEFQHCNRSMFRRSKRRIVVAGYKLWERKMIDTIFSEIPDEEVQRYEYIFNMTEPADRDMISSCMRPIETVFFSEITRNPFRDYPASVAGEIFPDYAVVNKKGKKLFSRREK